MWWILLTTFSQSSKLRNLRPWLLLQCITIPELWSPLNISGSPSSIERHWWKWRKYAVRLDNGALFVSKTSSDWRPGEKDIIAIYNCAMDGGETWNVNRIHGETKFRGQWWRQYLWTTLGHIGYLGPFGPIWVNLDHIWPLWIKNLVSRHSTQNSVSNFVFGTPCVISAIYIHHQRNWQSYNGWG